MANTIIITVLYGKYVANILKFICAEFWHYIFCETIEEYKKMIIS